MQNRSTVTSELYNSYVMRCLEQSQKSISMARSCLDSSVSLLRHSMKSRSPPWGPSSQINAHSLGSSSSRYVSPGNSLIRNHRIKINKNINVIYYDVKYWKDQEFFVSLVNTTVVLDLPYPTDNYYSAKVSNKSINCFSWIWKQGEQGEYVH